ncbi:MAG: hypothetical protein AB7S38_12505 [Vulcanimicrobiota bacterium]
MEPKQVNRRIFLKSAVAAGVTLVGLTGCESGGNDFVVTGSGGALNNFVPPNVPVLTLQTQVQPAVVPGVDAGTRHTVRVVASQGGLVNLPDGVSLLIPPGALPADLEISITMPSGQTLGANFLQYLFEPTGLVFNTPIFITLPFATLAAKDILLSFNSSPVNPIVDTGSELTNWDFNFPAGTQSSGGVTYAVNHFSWFMGLKATDLGLYLVTDIPPENLETGDILFVLSESDGKRWRPGHVAILLKEGNDEAPLNTDPGRCIEMPGGPCTINSLEHIQFSDDHVYLGPRRHPEGLTQSEQEQAAAFWLSKLGTQYAIIGDQGDDVIPITAGFSCVGLVDAGLRHIGKGLAGWIARQFVLTPLEYYQLTVPVTEMEVKVGKEFKMPVYGLVSFLGDDTLGNAPGLNLLGALGSYSRTLPYDIAPLQSPPGSVFVPAQLPTSSGGGPPNLGPAAPGYEFIWTPTPEQLGQIFELELLMVADRFNWQAINTETFLRDESRRTLRFTVVEDTRYRIEVIHTLVGGSGGEAVEGPLFVVADELVAFQALVPTTTADPPDRYVRIRQADGTLSRVGGLPQLNLQDFADDGHVVTDETVGPNQGDETINKLYLQGQGNGVRILTPPSAQDGATETARVNENGVVVFTYYKSNRGNPDPLADRDHDLGLYDPQLNASVSLNLRSFLDPIATIFNEHYRINRDREVAVIMFTPEGTKLIVWKPAIVGVDPRPARISVIRETPYDDDVPNLRGTDKLLFNDRGDLAWNERGSGAEEKLYLYTQGQVSELPVPADPFNRPVQLIALNNRGVLLGQQGERMVLWRTSDVTNFEIAYEGQISAQDMNDDGVILGRRASVIDGQVTAEVVLMRPIPQNAL